MSIFTIPEALRYLAETYGAESMPSSQETLRRAIRVGDLAVQEEGDPGRRGYTISRSDLDQYAQKRLERLQNRKTAILSRNMSSVPEVSRVQNTPLNIEKRENTDLKMFSEVYGKYVAGELKGKEYMLELLREKDNWSMELRRKKDQLIRLTSEMQSLQNDISGCEAAIEAFEAGIGRLHS